jgi:hypothetical protein
LPPQSKSEARVARQNLKALQDKEKSVRLVAKNVPIASEKVVRTGADPNSIFHMRVVIRCDNPDVED